MPSSIPYDHPSLTLGNVIDPALLARLKQLGSLQSKIDAAQDKMNSHMMLKRSLDMTVTELQAMNIDTSDLNVKIRDVEKSISDAAVNYAAVRLDSETQMQAVKEQIAEAATMEGIESPVDFESTGIQEFPLSSDSIKFDAQYFAYEDTNPSGSIDAIEKYIREAAGGLGSRASNDIAKASSGQISLQQKNHALSGTLIITANCTHKKSVLLSPCVIDVDKAIPVWNKLFPGSRIDATDEEKLRELSGQEEDKESPGISILSGASYGSSFVGMVHILKQDGAIAGKGSSLTALANSLQEKLTISGWLEEASGGFGLDPSLTDDIRNLLSTQRITAHITVVVMGCIPSIRSNQLQTGVRAFADADTSKLTSGLSSIINATSSEKKTVSQSANAGKTGAQVLSMQNATIQSIISGLGKIDQSANKMLDINSMMAAYEDYLEEVRKGGSGVPVSFYLKTLSQQQLAKLWLDKYYPEKDVAPNTEKGEENG